QSGAILGTPGYMAPEQATGQRQRLTTAADVYGLGAILYEMLIGQPPFRADTPVETLLLTIEKEPPRPRLLQPHIDADLETICLQCLQKEPERRYRSAQALAEDLERWLNGEPIRARPVGRAVALWRWCRRNPAVASLVGALILVFVSGFAGVSWKWLDAEYQKEQAKIASHRAEVNAQEALTQERQASAAEKVATARARELEKTLYFHSIALAHHEWLANNPHRAQQIVGECKGDHH